MIKENENFNNSRYKISSKSFLDQIVTFISRKIKFLRPSFVRCAPHYAPRPIKINGGQNLQLPSGHPSISIVIPSLNQGRFLKKAIASILDQQYPSLELIVVDGGSTDESKSIIKKYSNHINWWCSEPDAGQTQALNKGFARSGGQIMAWLNADDRLLPNSLARVSAVMACRPDVDVVYGQRILIDEDDKEIGRWILPRHNDRVLSWADFIPQETMFWRRGLWKKTGGRLDESFDFAMDWDLLLRFRDVNAKIIRLPYFLGLFRIHHEQKTSALIDEIGFEEMQKLRRRCLGYTPSQWQCLRGVSGYLIAGRFTEFIRKAGLIYYT